MKENRLTFMEYDDFGSPYYQLNQLAYDGLGRLREMVEDSWDGAEWVPNVAKNYIYDGMRVIQERDSNNVPLITYTRGRDLSGSFEGAGGIGGLLARSDGYDGNGNWISNEFYFADGNGNITYLTDGSQGLAASYKYDPFGHILAEAGPLATDNSYRFSSKEMFGKNLEWYGVIYYFGYRFYDPNWQRWLNRDPIHERGFRIMTGARGGGESLEINLYAFLLNDPLNKADALGLKDWGLLGGKCCNRSGATEWALVGTGQWKKLPPNTCTGSFEDCDGMTCGGGFYWLENLGVARCKTSGKDCPTGQRRRWTPTSEGPDAQPPVWDPKIGKGRGSRQGNTPPGYTYTN